MMNDCDKIQSADEIINVSELMMVCSVSGHENVYSNIPPAQVSPSGSAVGLLSPKRTSQGSSNLSAMELGSIPNGGHHHQQHQQQQQQQHQQHVYSNVTNATMNSGHLPDFQSSQAQTTGGSSGMLMTSSSSHQQLTAGTQQPHHIESSLADPALLSSSFIGNDLDLDDPVLTSSFATPKQSIPTGGSKASQLLSSSERSTMQLTPLKASQPITTIEMKNVIKTLDPNVIIQQQQQSAAPAGTTATMTTTTTTMATVNGGSSSNGFNNGIGTGSGDGVSPLFISPSASRMRLLQESTMIDTALDLDSLDGSIGNHSQSCLVKTAIV
ncbi:hypothetical protein AND_001474 [Anopheles darlingi]|nr:hypothetical protein AND_001474 [Anopheles darlingi]